MGRSLYPLAQGWGTGPSDRDHNVMHLMAFILAARVAGVYCSVSLRLLLGKEEEVQGQGGSSICCGLDQAPSLIQPSPMDSLRRRPVMASCEPTCLTLSSLPSSRVSPCPSHPTPQDPPAPPSWLWAKRPLPRPQLPYCQVVGLQTLIREAGHSG